MTYDDYAKLPDDGFRYELVDGKLELLPSPARSHQIVVRHLAHLLSMDCASEYEIVVAPVDVVLTPTEVRQPDLVMIHLDRMSIYKKRGNIVEPPDLVVEVVSPWSVKRDKIAKYDAYAKFGVPEYWIVDPENETVEHYQIGVDSKYRLVRVYTGDDKVPSDKLTCVSFTVTDIMSRLRNLPPD